jgi:DNA-directed RNA polymerase II subunit RPB9
VAGTQRASDRVPMLRLSPGASASNNLLYPKENKAEKKLYYACRNCAFQTEAKTQCVYVNEIKQSITYDTQGHAAGGSTCVSLADASLSGRPVCLSLSLSSANLNISRDTTLDPALKRTKAVRCPKCGNDEACFFARSDENMQLVFVCTNSDCAFHWTQNEKAEK